MDVWTAPAAENHLNQRLQNDKPTKTKIKKVGRDLACVACKNSKVRCDGERPCRRCLYKGFPEGCVDQEAKKMKTKQQDDVPLERIVESSSPGTEDELALDLVFVNHDLEAPSPLFSSHLPSSSDTLLSSSSDTLLSSSSDTLLSSSSDIFLSSSTSTLISSSSSSSTLLSSPSDAALLSSCSDAALLSCSSSDVALVSSPETFLSLSPDTFLSPSPSHRDDVDFNINFSYNIDRPLSYPNQVIVPSYTVETADEIPSLLQTIWHNQGVSSRQMCRMYNCMPYQLQSILSRGLTALEGLMKVNRSFLSCSTFLNSDLDLDAWSNNNTLGVQAVSVDANGRCSTYAVNNWLADLAGVHREEMVARMAYYDMNLASSEFRQICTHISGMMMLMSWAKVGFQGIPVRYLYSRWNKRFARGGEQEGVLIRQGFNPMWDKDGNFIGAVRTMEVVSEDEYDQVLLHNPEACELLAIQAVGKKPGKEMVSQRLLKEESIGYMVSNMEGRAQLLRLASMLESLFIPFIAEYENMQSPFNQQ